MDEHSLIAEILALVERIIADQRRARLPKPKPAAARVRRGVRRRG